VSAKWFTLRSGKWQRVAEAEARFPAKANIADLISSYNERKRLERKSMDTKTCGVVTGQGQDSRNPETGSPAVNGLFPRPLHPGNSSRTAVNSHVRGTAAV